MGSSELRTFEAKQVFHFSILQQDKEEKFPVLSCCDCFFHKKKFHSWCDWVVDYVHDITHAIQRNVHQQNKMKLFYFSNLFSLFAIFFGFKKFAGIRRTWNTAAALTIVNVWVRNNTIWEMSERGRPTKRIWGPVESLTSVALWVEKLRKSWI